MGVAIDSPVDVNDETCVPPVQPATTSAGNVVMKSRRSIETPPVNRKRKVLKPSQSET